jgi:methylphosphotriester-DNA--protein-cysteine methyltransferase
MASRKNDEHILSQFCSIIERHPDEILRSDTICSQLGVSGRTLRNICRNSLKMSPRQFAARHRMELARQQLRAGSRVTTAATNHGFFELGRFASTYRKVYGELPSETMRMQRA